ncbi:amidohydrolase family protein [Streptomyces sp. NPDC021218]|uniref:amidohydrolase family protein n=1 Tax=unclassified Streptomyces TaxID=2593676 RepID=UPI0036B536AB
MPSRLLLKNGFVLTLDPALGDLPRADVLVEDGKIAQIGPDLPVTDAETLDAAGTVVVPGFVDTHRHMWETVLRGVLPACTLDGYLAQVIGAIGPAYRPEDVCTGNLLGALEALNAGITTIVDWSHCNNTPEHADAGITALRAAGIRAMYAHGTPAGGEWWAYSELGHPADARRIREQYFSSEDDLLTFSLAVRGPGVSRPEVCVHDWRLARELEARISVHVGMRITSVHGQAIAELDRAGLLGPDTTYVHANTSTDDELAMIKRTGGSASVAPYVEMLMGHGHPPITRMLEQGVTPSLSIDVATSVPGDMFTQMRTALAQGRISSFGDDVDVAFAPALTHADVLGFATRAGAQACGLADRIGTLAPGKDADIVLIRADDINTMPLVDPVATVVTSADTANVDTVIVRGEIRKRAGKLVGVDLARLRADAERSRDHVLRSSGMTPSWLPQN